MNTAFPLPLNPNKRNQEKAAPVRPPANERYPSKQELVLGLLERFREAHRELRVKCVLADALHGSARFVNQASQIFAGVQQVISQLRGHQNIRFRGKKYSLERYLTRYPGVTQSLHIRGGEAVNVTVGSARLVVCAHGQKRFVIALKYQGEQDYRYWVATDLSWRTLDIVQAYTFRWLIEVFFSDWKAYEGWGNLTQ